jgi:formylglycine-generating enzyme required for sulfatase activity
MNLIRILAVVVVASAASSAGAVGVDDASWLKQQKAQFTAYKANHPHPGALIARIRAKTTALLAAAPPLDASAIDRPATIWNATDQPVELWDGAGFPEMIVVPAGESTIGSPLTEPDRLPFEGPLRRVRIGYAFAVSKYPITVGEYARFTADTHYDAGNSCWTHEKDGDKVRDGRTWRTLGFDETANTPAVCMNWDDVQAYVAWLSKKTGHAYRLLSDSEYEYANRAGTRTTYWWGDDIGVGHANCDGCGSPLGNIHPAPAGSFAPNPFGLYDTTGNGWMWLADCAHAPPKISRLDAPSDGSADLTGDCKKHMMRAGSWNNKPPFLHPALHVGLDLTAPRYDVSGFRVAMTL